MPDLLDEADYEDDAEVEAMTDADLNRGAPKTSARVALNRLADAFVEDIMSMTDEEILAEAIEDGIDPEENATRMRAIFERAVAEADGTMTIHELKTLPEYFQAVWLGDKRAELRKDDRGFNVGDGLLLREWDGAAYTGRSLRAQITHIVRDGEWLTPGYAMLSIMVRRA